MRILLITVVVLLSGCSGFWHGLKGGLENVNRNHEPPRVHRPNFNQIERDAQSGQRAADAMNQCRSNSIYTSDGRYMNCQTCCVGSSCNTSCY